MSVVYRDGGSAGRPITIEVEADGPDLEEIYGSDQTRGPDGRIVRAGRSLFGEALDLVEACSEAVQERIEAMTPRRPDEVELQLAIKVDGKAGARLVEVTAGAQIQVTLRWKAPADGH